MQAVNKIFTQGVLGSIAISIIALILISQNAQERFLPSYNRGGYVLKVEQDGGLEQKNMATVYGHIYDVSSKEVLSASLVNWFCTEFISSEDGFYSFSIPGGLSGDIYFSVKSIGYRSVETENLKIHAGDSIRLDFFLDQNDRPIFHCD